MEPAMESIPEYRASVAVWQYCPPVLFAFGTFGNTMTVVILRRMKRKRSAMPVYLTALAVSDTCQLLTGLLRGWLMNVFHVDVRTLHSAVCKVHTWLVYSFIILSAWLLSFMTLERTLSVWKPHRVSLLCTRGKAIVVIVVIIVVSMSANCHLLLWVDVVGGGGVEGNGTGTGASTSTSSRQCHTPDPDYQRFFEDVWSWVDLTLSSLLPFTLVLLGNVLIVWKVSLSVRAAKSLGSSRPQDISQRQRRTSSMTVTLMALSAIFFITTSPICVFNIIEPYVVQTRPQDDLRSTARLLLAWAVVNMLMYTNSTLNFYLYCLSGTRFRRELKQCLCCYITPAPSPSKNQDGATVTNPSPPPAVTAGVPGPLALVHSPCPGGSNLAPGHTRLSNGGRKKKESVGSGGGGGRGGGNKRETNNCLLLSVQTCDHTYLSCSDF